MADDESSESPREDEIRKAVRDRYRQVAVKEVPCCPQESEAMCGCRGIYSSPEMQSLPAEALVASAGCGNPMAIAELREGMTVVDLGSGGGIDVFLASKRVGTSGKVYGIDATPEMVFRARRTAMENGFNNVEFRLGEIEHIPLDPCVADVVISNCVINLSPDKMQVFSEAFRILKPGGRLAVSDIVLLRELPPELRNDLAAWSACVSGALLKKDYLQAMIRSGFESVEVVSEEVYSTEQLNSYILKGQSESDLTSTVASCKVTALRPKLGS
ncbi:MAG TPA: arsenite methyltransferase [Thermoplasmata archaeon]|nr:arsenite methyltransferase [Thermoplasmata archaeon]